MRHNLPVTNTGDKGIVPAASGLLTTTTVGRASAPAIVRGQGRAYVRKHGGSRHRIIGREPDEQYRQVPGSTVR